MERLLILETTFLIDLERERRSGGGPAIEFLKGNVDCQLWITHTIAGELACGASLSTAKRWSAFCRPFRTLEWTPEVDWRYGQLYRYLKGQGRLIGSNDLWIAATALVHACPVVTA
ncbi:MAG TPA: type II toxin-antitoxin system VapC family toxin, partial [Opitutales bacterium]|nr:type II toxin-antitoxin system VapC family toxin [Opitutales bacterium]